MTSRSLSVLCAIVTSVFSVQLGATVLVPADLAELSRDAQVIVRGRIVATTATATGDWRSIETIVTLQTDAFLKGAAGRTVQFRVPGGQLGRYRRIVVGAPELTVGQRVIVFLAPGVAGAPYVLGLSQGVFRLVPGDDGWTVTPPAVLLSGSAPQPIVRGDTVRRPMPLEDFEQHVRALAATR
jgi:hypothetical protein